MAQIERKRPLLSLCIPIYNRIAFLERQFERMLEDKELFEEQIQLIISDNCSTDNLQSCCDNYQALGLHLKYHRQVTNIGPDGNFDWCFHHAEGKYVWLLGSDDIPVKGLLQKLVDCLSCGDYGLVHLSMKKLNQEMTIYHNSDDMAIAVNYWITFMSANIIRTESLNNIDLSEYKDSFMIQVPAYLNACCSFKENAIIYQDRFFESETDSANNGGYNLFQVFVTNLFGIYKSFIDKGLLSKSAFDKILKIEYREFLLGYIIDQLVYREKGNFSTDGGWRSLWAYYRMKPYAYCFLTYRLLDEFLGHRLSRIRKCFVGQKY